MLWTAEWSKEEAVEENLRLYEGGETAARR
jgi:hypothetical protein